MVRCFAVLTCPWRVNKFLCQSVEMHVHREPASALRLQQLRRARVSTIISRPSLHSNGPACRAPWPQQSVTYWLDKERIHPSLDGLPARPLPSLSQSIRP